MSSFNRIRRTALSSAVAASVVASLAVTSLAIVSAPAALAAETV